MNVKKKIIELAKEKGMNLNDVAKASGISRCTIYKWDNFVPTLDKAKKVAEAIGCTLDDLAEGL